MQATNPSGRPLTGRTVLVTGAGKGLGAAFARSFAGAEAAFADLSKTLTARTGEKTG